MATLTSILTRTSCQDKYVPTPVPRECLRQLLEAVLNSNFPFRLYF